ncbi:endoribonuclease Dcr-1 [Phymastichus coffea]|uniref:endoribonuclease Dcr-1 n=1 Tax=Phymastichus coffea TaxID=108790 RepID=UPI00273BEEFB|nr:endoribonuclease Dcr-1 [Phymastichus coffea]
MAFFFNDQIHTNSFTPREHQVELLYSAKERNIIICLGKIAEQTFITNKLIQELAINNRKSLHDNGKRTIYLLENEQSCNETAFHIEQLTDLKVLLCSDVDDFNIDQFNLNTQVLVLTVEICCKLLNTKKIIPSQINLLIIDKCHNLVTNNELRFILETFRSCDNDIKIIGFAVPLYSLTKEPGQLSFAIERIESLLRCKIETASDLLSILRYSPKPKEYMLAYKTECRKDIENYLQECRNFLQDHRYDPTEIYSEEFLEEIKKIPDPRKKPLELIQEFLYILETLGLWAADRAALILLMLIEKLKIKTPYDRHYLLLGIIATLFLKIRAYCDHAFNGLSETEKIKKFSTPKVHRMLEVLRTFTPPAKEENLINNHEKTIIKDQNNQEKPAQSPIKKMEPGFKKQRPFRFRGLTDPDLMCGVIFVDNTITAKVLFYLLNELSKCEDAYHFLSPLYTSEKTNDDILGGRDIEMEHRKQEEVLKKFRIHECNLLISTSVLEEGIDIPKCNFVMRFDFPKNYQSYVQCKSRARATDALHILLVPDDEPQTYVQQLAHYHYIEKILLAKCSNKENNELEELEADAFCSLLPEYKPLDEDESPKVTLNSAITLINRYCAKLPSDTFTKLTPEWKINPIKVQDNQMYICSLRLPINSPLKYLISSYPMPNKSLAKRIAALQLCIRLHKENEIDDYLIPVGKENFKANPEDTEVPALPGDEKMDLSDARPGTTKRRQYYYKKIAGALTDCKPEFRKPCYLYHIHMMLSCPLPEEQNTRGRKIYPPEDSAIGFGILTYKKIPKVCPFPIYTRSGEVRVELKLSKETVVLDETQNDKVVSFLNYTFTNVLRLQKYLMLFDPNVSENSYMIVPVKKLDGSTDMCVDWGFLECIYANRKSMPNLVSEEERRNFTFDANKYHDAVIMPWYRNQDQPQYFYVAEICNHLNPKSSFPGADYSTFEEYYLKKYCIQIQNLEQPLLDVDHTSARLNFLTPRYVNRKGVALPTSSEETKRAKRENLEQKQILVAELCAIHPFPASLWRQAVCLPCILYRINALLLADQIRRQVASAINLGMENLAEDFEWPPLDFGWSLADVLKKSKENEKAKEAEKMKEEEKTKEMEKTVNREIDDRTGDCDEKEDFVEMKEKKDKIEKIDDNLDELEIGTWSNEMLNTAPINGDSVYNWGNVRYGSPTYDSEFDDDDSDCSDDFDDSMSDSSDEGLLIEYTGDNVAEAIDKKGLIELDKLNCIKMQEKSAIMQWNLKDDDKDALYHKHEQAHMENVKQNEERIVNEGVFITSDTPVTFKRKATKVQNIREISRKHEEYVSVIAECFIHEVVNSPRQTYNKQVPALHFSALHSYTDGTFSFDYQPELKGHSGPSPSLILQALTMSNANDGINLERLETIGDSFLKYAITTYLFCSYNNIHEGKLSHLRSKQVSNLNLYRLGRQKMLGESMIATKFEPHDNWLPPCYYVPKELEQVLIESGIPVGMWNIAPFREIGDLAERLEIMKSELDAAINDPLRSFIPYNLITQHSIPDKSIADCVEALIGAYLIACGPRGALLFMTWLGIRVLPTEQVSVIQEEMPKERPTGSTIYVESINEDGKKKWTHVRYKKLPNPPSPLFYNVSKPEIELEIMLDGYTQLEESIGYHFRNRSYLLQAFTHASYQPNKLTDCYQRLEFLGDAVLDYLITRHLYEDPRQHSPGALTDLRSALVNNTIFASLAVRCGFHKYFRHLSPGLNTVIDRFVRIQEENGHSISEEFYLIDELDEAEEAEDVEVPKALGDVFESLAGAIYLDSNMSLDAVWKVYFEIMKSEIELFSSNVPKSPIRELLELEPETAKFGKPEKLADGRRVRVTVDVFNKGLFKGIGRNYRIAKCTAAKCALRKLKKMQLNVRGRK